MALWQRNLQSCKVLIAAGADLTYAPSYILSPFDLAWDIILSGTEDPTTIELLQSLFPGNDYLETHGFSNLHKIVLGILHCDMETKLAKCGVDIDAIDSKGRSALSWAARRGDRVTVDFLVKAQANLNLRDDVGKSPLLWALQAPTLSCAELLLQLGADVTILNHAGQHALYYAAVYHDSAEMIKRLVDKGADVNAIDRNRHTALLGATERGHILLVNALLDGGADIDVLDPEGDSSLMQALLEGHIKVVALLLEKGAGYEWSNINDESLLHYTAKGNNNLETLDILEAAMLQGIDPDAVNKAGKTALQLARQRTAKPAHFVERFETPLAGIRERNKAKSNGINSILSCERPVDTYQRIDTNISIRAPRHVSDSGSPIHYRFPWLQGIRNDVMKSTMRINSFSFWPYLLLGFGWVGFFFLLISPDHTNSLSLHSPQHLKANDDALSKVEVLPCDSTFRSPRLDSDTTTTQPFKISHQRGHCNVE